MQRCKKSIFFLIFCSGILSATNITKEDVFCVLNFYKHTQGQTFVSATTFLSFLEKLNNEKKKDLEDFIKPAGFSVLAFEDFIQKLKPSDMKILLGKVKFEHLKAKNNFTKEESKKLLDSVCEEEVVKENPYPFLTMKNFLSLQEKNFPNKKMTFDSEEHFGAFLKLILPILKDYLNEWILDLGIPEYSDVSSTPQQIKKSTTNASLKNLDILENPVKKPKNKNSASDEDITQHL